MRVSFRISLNESAITLTVMFEKSGDCCSFSSFLPLSFPGSRAIDSADYLLGHLLFLILSGTDGLKELKPKEGKN